MGPVDKEVKLNIQRNNKNRTVRLKRDCTSNGEFFMDTIINVYDAVAKSSENFDALGKVIKGLVTVALTPLKLTFFAVQLALQQAQLAWEDSFFGGGDKGKIAQLKSDILETKSAIGEVAQSAIDAGKELRLNIQVDADYTVGNTWSDTH